MATFFIILAAIFLYKLTVDFIIPIYRASRRVQEQFRNMQRSQQSATQPEFQRQQNTTRPGSKSSDYIDFEEIKD